MNSFKYSQSIQDLPDCPPKEYESANRIAYHFVFEDITNSDNFQPKWLRHPRGLNDTSDRKKCQAWGLSFFDSKQSAKNKFSELKKQFENIGKKIGNYLAEGKLTVDDGVISIPDKKGHFTLHEYADVKLNEKFQIVDKLV